MNLRSLFFACCLIVLAISCEKKENTEKNCCPENGLTIKMSDACGWCAGTDSLIITQSNTCYGFNNQCNDNYNFHNLSTNDNDWSELTTLLNLEEFKEIDINNCYVCFDGCDRWISVQSDNYSHEIRFGYNDTTAVKNILPFIQKLENIKLSFSEN